MSENINTDHGLDSTSNAQHHTEQPQIPEPKKKKPRYKMSWIWLIPIVALLIALSLAVKAVWERGPTIDVSFRTADGLEAGKTNVRYKQVNIGLVRQIKLAPDNTHVIAQIELSKDSSNFAAKDSRFWVVRPRIGTTGVSGIDTLLSGSYIEVDGGKASDEQTNFVGLETPPVVPSDVPGKVFFLTADNLGSLDIGSPIYYRRMNVGQITAYNLSEDGKHVEMQTFIRSPYDKFVTTDARFWQASGVDVSLNASGFSLNTQSLASIVTGGVAFGYPDNSNAQIAPKNSQFTLWNTKVDALKVPDGKPHKIVMYFDTSLRGLSAGAPIDFMGINIGDVTAINVEFDPDYSKLRMRVDAVLYPSRLAHGKELDPAGTIFKRFIQQGWRAQMRTGNLLTGQNYIAFDKFAKAKPVTLIHHDDGLVEVPTIPPELNSLQAQVSEIAGKVSKFPIDEIGADVRKTLKSMNNTIDSTDKLVKQLDSKVAPDFQATLNDARKTMQSTESVLSSDAPMQQDLRKALQQVTRTAASLQLMADYIEEHPEALIRGKKGEVKNAK
ncbi:PqiB family protein [Acinetobacter rathckeae]|uniref:PqiB family protein n=1 Tax=Acinetobacter rathckeae TaxID=2605272 RepID=UPI0018A2ABA7|nr:MlaD family protein [Acinetobacter rathckeae]MBF7688180.1 MCE family protein [Acinetobacter rathckeae]MBF7695309.1 MCE family protein [Acinetobacter rathckeae]